MAKSLNKKCSASAGFTLIEILVVLAIVALIASVVAVNAPPMRDIARDEADRFAARLDVASQQAIMTGSMIGLDLTQEEYHFYRYERGSWTLIEAAQLQPRRFSSDVSVSIEIPGRVNAEAGRDKDQEREEDFPSPNIFFAPTGETTPLELKLGADRRFWSISLSASGDISVANDEQS